MPEIPESCGALCLKRNDASFHIAIFVFFKTKTGIESQENIAVLKRGMSQSHASWSSKDWSLKSNWQRFVVEDAGQRSQDQVEGLETLSKVERDFSQRGRTGYTRERKEKTPGPKVARKVRKEKPKYTLCRKVWLTTPKLKTVTDADSGKF